MTRFDPFSVFPIFVFLIVILGILYAGISRQRFLHESIAYPQKGEIAPTATIIPTQTQTPTLYQTSNPSASPTQQGESPSSTPAIPSSLKYPDSTVISESQNSLKLSSTDTPVKITAWYKEQLKAINFNIHTSNMTNANNNILNTLSAAKNDANVNIEIQKSAGNPKTVINIEYKL